MIFTKINYYIVNVHSLQLNHLLIRVRKISNSRYVCFYISENLVYKFETLGFVVYIGKDNSLLFKNGWNTPSKILEEIWLQISAKIDFPDRTLEIKGSSGELDDRLL
jgi:hypothetical protein